MDLFCAKREQRYIRGDLKNINKYQLTFAICYKFLQKLSTKDPDDFV